MSIKISQNFDAGAIEVVDSSNVNDIQLKLRKDSHADFAQWFYFRLQGARNQDATIRILNANEAAYPDGWEGYRAVASYDRENWFRVETEYDGKVMTIKHTPDFDSVYYAYFEPYSWERHLALLGSVGQSDQVSVVDLGNTVDGRDLNMVVVGDPKAEKKVWIIARQHPGETMAEWLVEGTLNALLDPANPTARAILDRAVLYVVPNMNPDGSVRGNLRTNAAGANLNREWMTPSIETSPEVYYVKKKIEEVGCDLFLDIHGDEGLPYVFVAGSEMLEGFSEKQMQEQNAFVESFCAASPDFQTKFGYEASKYNEDLLKLASKYIGHTYKCVSLTLELPFKDNANMPDLEVGWDGMRSMKLGEAMLQPILHSLKG
ncbi:M14-type cytosolic carboxypeptidase [Undibacterium cyanobacteriorum]|uniref:M14-type cytosolic carboxypeptidase n=1 Tax=Undibacterium cyanobacteriorum TaxID=3073561 RepID=A0ABY9REB4_9BURK|nr:M14-type cytosolic carboxypeptidase [Undibacterium sp. 20NA77.5]WMW78990.1 M14-type cytosolic carboxypeptidase [Undibacterium sp. 20NA77.5]